jgi:hypothetical protein
VSNKPGALAGFFNLNVTQLAPLEFREDDGAKTESASQRLIELL